VSEAYLCSYTNKPSEHLIDPKPETPSTKQARSWCLRPLVLRFWVAIAATGGLCHTTNMLVGAIWRHQPLAVQLSAGYFELRDQCTSQSPVPAAHDYGHAVQLPTVQHAAAYWRTKPTQHTLDISICKGDGSPAAPRGGPRQPSLSA
jgi:hypothetical protein